MYYFSLWKVGACFLKGSNRLQVPSPSDPQAEQCVIKKRVSYLPVMNKDLTRNQPGDWVSL